MANSTHDRKYVRIETDATLDYLGAAVMLDHRIENLSGGGLSVCCPSPETVGTMVLVTINFPDYQDSITVKGKVAWVKAEPKKTMGIEFMEVSPRDRRVLDRYLSERKVPQ
jgi:uncharacterized protein (TIGR02266 family)